MKLAHTLLPLLAALSCPSPVSLLAQEARDLSSPTVHRYLYGASEASLAAAVSEGYRITDLEIEGLSPLRFSAVMVHNSGDYAADWWWYYGQTATQVEALLSQQQGRLIDVNPYEDMGQTRFACVMVSNTGAEAKNWWWYHGVSSAFIGLQAANNIARLVDMDRYEIAGSEFYSTVMIANAGSDARGWWWLLGVDKNEIDQNIQRNGSRVWDIERRSDGSFDAILVLDRVPRPEWSWSCDLSPEDLDAWLDQSGYRLIDIERYEDGGTRFAAAMIDNRIQLSGSVVSIGTGCGGSSLHSQSSETLPMMGGNMIYLSQNAAPNSPVALLLGFSSSQWGSLKLPLDLASIAAPGCMLYSSVQRSFLGQSDASGNAVIQLPIPDDTGLIGFTYYSQFVAIDPSANFLGLTMSNAMVSTIGNPLP